MAKKVSAKDLHNAKKLNSIIDHLESQSSDPNARGKIEKRKELFSHKVKPISQELAVALRAQQNWENDQKSPNPLADMCYALGRCFQCAVVFPPDERARQVPLAKSGQIFLCLDCFKSVQRANDGDKTVSLGLPFGASKLCEEEFEKLKKQSN